MAGTRHLRDTAGDPAAVAQLRRRRASFTEIAAHLGVTPEQAVELYRQALEQMPGLARHEYQAEEILLADDAVRDLLAIARNHDPSARTSVEAWSAIRMWAEHKAKLLGLDTAKALSQPGPSRLEQIRAARA